MKREDFMTVPISKVILAKVDAFLLTTSAKRLNITSRPDFFHRLAIAFLSKHDREYDELVKLFDLSEKELRDAKLEK